MLKDRTRSRIFNYFLILVIDFVVTSAYLRGAVPHTREDDDDPTKIILADFEQCQCIEERSWVICEVDHDLLPVFVLRFHDV